MSSRSDWAAMSTVLATLGDVDDPHGAAIVLERGSGGGRLSLNSYGESGELLVNDDTPERLRAVAEAILAAVPAEAASTTETRDHAAELDRLVPVFQDAWGAADRAGVEGSRTRVALAAVLRAKEVAA